MQLQNNQSEHRTIDAYGSQHLRHPVKSANYLKTRDARSMQIGSKTRTPNVDGMSGALVQSAPLRHEAEQIAGSIGVRLRVYDTIRLGGGHKSGFVWSDESGLGPG